MDERAIVRESFYLAKRDLGLEEDFDFSSTEDVDERLLAFLEMQISDLLDRDFARLLNALYRIDIPEQKVKEILANPAGNISATIAKAVIEREKQKVITRAQYRQS